MNTRRREIRRTANRRNSKVESRNSSSAMRIVWGFAFPVSAFALFGLRRSSSLGRRSWLAQYLNGFAQLQVVFTAKLLRTFGLIIFVRVCTFGFPAGRLYHTRGYTILTDGFSIRSVIFSYGKQQRGAIADGDRLLINGEAKAAHAHHFAAFVTEDRRGHQLRRTRRRLIDEYRQRQAIHRAGGINRQVLSGKAVSGNTRNQAIVQEQACSVH